ncbi:MAG: xylose isomerase [Flavobacteriales bacterium CG_4_8_14_3_um_filter_35_10]|nr:TIM barrel protein [Zetaproteobacteria bacterium]PIX06212.1 MAG: xylose isomerase [Flavobacteriales bacterium CG_4_8_14_3_um_filter_35_10]PJA06719.1 MAG: xylose isomerase [Flavobacteriales bacterium CG_4_10_14_0_2_um_filter_35_18]
MSKFIKISLIIIGVMFIITSFKTSRKNSSKAIEAKPYFKLSLAEWSVHKAIVEDKTLDPIDFAQKAHDMGFEGLEYVSQLYTNYLKIGNDPKVAMQNLLKTLKMKSDKYGLQNLTIMVDNEGDLASENEKDRNEAVENHKKWIDAGAFLGCHSIRVNLFGSDNSDIWSSTSAKSLKQLAEYAKAKNVNVIVENHGYFSSNADLLTDVIKKVGLKNCGVLPDFGNFCLKREGGARWGAKCVEEYNRYEGVEKMMPFAKAVSAKSYDFDKEGNETLIDYYKMLQIVKDGGYKGFIGIEYEGSRLSEDEGIIATKNLVLKAAQALH